MKAFIFEVDETNHYSDVDVLVRTLNENGSNSIIGSLEFTQDTWPLFRLILRSAQEAKIATIPEIKIVEKMTDANGL